MSETLLCYSIAQVSKHFITTVSQLLSEGLTISRIELYILRSRENYAATLYLRVKSLPSAADTLAITSTPLNLIRFPTPSNDIISKCFIAHFFENKKYYDLQLELLTAANDVSFDHTFKVASNIGFLRGDNKWINQYNSVFFVMNEVGQVIAWQLTKTTSMDEVELLLANVANRFQKQSSSELPVFVDNCCLLRDKLTAIMGSRILVKLDLFHAVQRITRTIPKRHPFFLRCMADLKLVFRQPTDIGFIRMLATPDSIVINANLDRFLKKWEKCAIEGSKVITEKTQTEISSLKKHVTKGCLSGIPKGAGTTRNEAFHRVLNVHFGRVSRIGIPLAFALLTLLIYQHNCKIQGKLGLPSPPLALVKEKAGNQVSTELFGVVRKNDCDMDSWIAHKCDKLGPNNNITESEIHLSEAVAELITLTKLIEIFQSAYNMCNVIYLMKKVTANSPLINPSLMPFMSSVSNIILTGDHIEDSSLACEHQKRLNDIVNSCKLKLHPVSGDGNCLFSAVAFSLIKNRQSLLQHDPNFFALKCLETDNISELKMTLRKLIVEEWKNNEHFYQGFLTSESTSVAEEAEKFLQCGYYHSELGDTMVTGLANALELVIVVFSSINNYPIMNIVPRHIYAPVSLFIAFNQFGAGHYDGLLPAEDPKLVETSQLPKEINSSYCTCGRGDKKNNTH